MQAVILAAGKSTRTYPLTVTRPKLLLKIANKTILEHNLDQLKGIVDEVIIVVGYLKEQIIAAYPKECAGIKLTYVEQKKQLGTADAAASAIEKIKDRFILMMGDDLYSRKDIEKCINHKYCVLGKSVDDPEKWGIFISEKGILKKIIEKPKDSPSNIANSGLYLMDRKVFDYTTKKSERGELEFVDLVSALAKDAQVNVEIVEDYWIPVGYPWHVLEANVFLLRRLTKPDIKGEIEEGVTIKGNVVIGKGTVVKSGTYIEGPVMIGENCTIGPHAYIRPDTTIGNNCNIRSELYDTVIFDNVTSKHYSYLGHSVIGEKCNIGAGTITSDFRHDGKNHITLIKGQKVDSKRRKLGAFFGDSVNTGINTSIYPGRKIWPNLSTLPGEVLTKDRVE